MPPASFKQSQPWASRFERAEGEGGEEAGGDLGCGDCGDHSDGQGDGNGSGDGGDNSGDHGAW